MAVGHAVDRGGNAQEMFKKLGRDVLIHFIVPGEFQRNAQQVGTIHCHPAGAIRLVDEAAGGQRRTAVEHADVVQPQKAALKDIASLGVLAVHPPGEVQQQLVEDPLQKSHVAHVLRIGFPPLFAVQLEYAPGGPGMDRRIHIAKLPFVGRQLAIGVHVPFAR